MVDLPAGRRMGDGYEPHVDEVEGRLVYSLPVDSGFASTSFSFDIQPRDLDVLLTDPYRRAVLESVAHTVLQRSMLRENPRVTQEGFADLVAGVLHRDAAALEWLAAEVDRDYNIRTEVFVRNIMARRAAGAR